MEVDEEFVKELPGGDGVAVEGGEELQQDRQGAPGAVLASGEQHTGVQLGLVHHHWGGGRLLGVSLVGAVGGTQQVPQLGQGWQGEAK